jgi:hypothetical protein
MTLNVIIYGLESFELSDLSQKPPHMICRNAQNGDTPAHPIGQVDSNPQVALLHNLSCTCYLQLLSPAIDLFLCSQGSTVLTDASSKVSAGENPLS